MGGSLNPDSVCVFLLSILSEWIATVADMELLVCKYVCMFNLKVLSLDILKLLENCIFTLILFFVLFLLILSIIKYVGSKNVCHS